MVQVGLFIKDNLSLEYNQVEFFDDEKISVTSSIQNINNIGGTYSDFSQTFTIPNNENNNVIFKNWSENSLDVQFNTLTKSDAYIELNTIPFKVGKVQLEIANDKHYSITFIGNLGNLKDKFAGLFLKDLNSTFFDLPYSAQVVKDRVATNAISSNVMFPLISSNRYWNYAKGGVEDISLATNPIRYNELFPALKLQAVFNMIQTQFGVYFNGDFLANNRFAAAYLYLKNAEIFKPIGQLLKINYQTQTGGTTQGITFNLATDILNFEFINPYYDAVVRKITINTTHTIAGVTYAVFCFKDGVQVSKVEAVSILGSQSLVVFTKFGSVADLSNYEFYFSSDVPMTFTSSATLYTQYRLGGSTLVTDTSNINQTISQTTASILSLRNYMPEIKIEDFFGGILKMFNLTCYSENGIDYTIEPIENYYNSGEIIDLTNYIKEDSFNFTRVKTYKKINFLFEKSESLVNIGFNSANGVNYGDLLYNTTNDGEEYSIKLPFENLNFNNLIDKLQVGYCLKSDLQKYIPKPVILYDYNKLNTTNLVGATPYFSTQLIGNGTVITKYKAFGQEYNSGAGVFSLNFPQQQSTLTNEIILNSLYEVYYSNYIENIFNYRARIVKVSSVLPISILTSLKLNNRIIILDKRYIINSFTTDLTSGEALFELITDLRELIAPNPFGRFLISENGEPITAENLTPITI